MSCKRLTETYKPAPLLHRALCPECRHAWDADARVQLTFECIAAEPVPEAGLMRTLNALSLEASGDAEIMERKRRSTRRWSRGIAAAIGALVLAAVGWLWWIDLDPNVKVPNPTMPSPNAFTSFRAAGEALRREEAIAELTDHKSNRPTSIPPTPRDREVLVAQNAEALRLLRQGFVYEYREPPARSFNHLYPHYAKDRSLARLLALEAAVYEEKGQIERANSSDLDAIDLGIEMQRGSTLIGKLVGIACEAIGRAGLWNRLDRMGESEAREAALRLESLNSLRTSMADTLTEEKYATVAGLMEMMRRPHWRWAVIQQNDPEGHLHSLPEAWEFYLMMLPHSKHAIVNRYLELMDRLIRATSQYPVLVPPEDDITREHLDPINQMLAATFSAAISKDASDDAANRLLACALAVRAYRVDHGRLPTSLQQVAQAGCLRRIPTDPFDPQGRSVRYLTRYGQPVIYSVGPDRTDNGGVPITNPEAEEGMRHSVQPKSLGDIVAGVNR
jgi:type II secretory pathway pseudopilin PulG